VLSANARIDDRDIAAALAHVCDEDVPIMRVRHPMRRTHRALELREGWRREAAVNDHVVEAVTRPA
jgi:hypothetical protein